MVLRIALQRICLTRPRLAVGKDRAVKTLESEINQVSSLREHFDLCCFLRKDVLKLKVLLAKFAAWDRNNSAFLPVTTLPPFRYALLGLTEWPHPEHDSNLVLLVILLRLLCLQKKVLFLLICDFGSNNCFRLWQLWHVAGVPCAKLWKCWPGCLLH